jgi:hypothetical protein
MSKQSHLKKEINNRKTVKVKAMVVVPPGGVDHGSLRGLAVWIVCRVFTRTVALERVAIIAAGRQYIK